MKTKIMISIKKHRISVVHDDRGGFVMKIILIVSDIKITTTK
jgi:hypothetical protein